METEFVSWLETGGELCYKRKLGSQPPRVFLSSLLQQFHQRGLDAFLFRLLRTFFCANSLKYSAAGTLIQSRSGSFSSSDLAGTLVARRRLVKAIPLPLVATDSASICSSFPSASSSSWGSELTGKGSVEDLEGIYGTNSLSSIAAEVLVFLSRALGIRPSATTLAVDPELSEFLSTGSFAGVATTASLCWPLERVSIAGWAVAVLAGELGALFDLVLFLKKVLTKNFQTVITLLWEIVARGNYFLVTGDCGIRLLSVCSRVRKGFW